MGGWELLLGATGGGLYAYSDGGESIQYSILYRDVSRAGTA